MSSVQYRYATCRQPEAPILMMTQLMFMGPAESLSLSLSLSPRSCVVHVWYGGSGMMTYSNNPQKIDSTAFQLAGGSKLV